MSRPVSAPRLAKVDPEQVAAAAVGRLLHHVEQVAIPLSPMVQTMDRSGSPSATPLGHSVAALCVWAQRGHGDPSELEDLFRQVASPLLGRPVDSGTPRTPDFDRELDADPSDEILLVLLAARARLRLARGQPIAPREVAVLSGRSSDNVRLHIRRGNLQATRSGLVDAGEAARWLREVERVNKEGLQRSPSPPKVEEAL